MNRKSDTNSCNPPCAGEERAQAEYDKQVRAKVTAARSDIRPGINTVQLRQKLHESYQVLCEDQRNKNVFK